MLRFFISTKKVRAARIKSITPSAVDPGIRSLPEAVTYEFNDPGIPALAVPYEQAQNLKAEVGGTLVRYESGYLGYCPQWLFEAEHVAIDVKDLSDRHIDGFWPYQSLKVVAAGPITKVSEDAGWGFDVWVGDFRYNANHDWRMRWEGKYSAGDYLVVYANGFVSVSPKADFEAGYLTYPERETILTAPQ